VSIVYILYIVSIPYARNMHGKEVFFVWFRTCDLADKGINPIRLYLYLFELTVGFIRVAERSGVTSAVTRC
jgi:hypothetical protein